MSEGLRECPVPWCREAEQISFIASMWTGKACVECLSCNARGPFCATKAEAIAAWNTRECEDGFVFVPVEPTEAMVWAGVEERNLEDHADTDVRAIYRAMLAAARMENSNSTASEAVPDDQPVASTGEGSNRVK